MMASAFNRRAHVTTRKDLVSSAGAGVGVIGIPHVLDSFREEAVSIIDA